MTDEELLLHHTEIRKNRLYRKPATTTSVEKKSKAVKKLGISKEELERMIKELDDEKT